MLGILRGVLQIYANGFGVRRDKAITSMRANIALCERTKNRWDMGAAYRYRGLSAFAAGQCDKARAHLEKSLEIFGDSYKGWDIRSEPLILQSLAGLASLKLCFNPAIAAEQLTLILSHPSALHSTKSRAKELTEGLPVSSPPTLECAVDEALQK